MRGQDLLGKRGARSRHADDEHRPLAVARSRERFPDEGRTAHSDDPIDESGEPLPLVACAVAPGELIGRLIVAEGLIPLPHVVEVFSERVAQVDLLRERQRRAEQPPGAFEPGAILTPHAPMRDHAAVRGHEIRIEGDGAVEQLLCFGEPAAVGAQLAQQRQRCAAARLGRECRLAARLGIGGKALHAQRGPESQVCGHVVRL